MAAFCCAAHNDAGGFQGAAVDGTGLDSSVCYGVGVRLHINLDPEMVAELDRRAGRRGRSAYIAELIRQAFDDQRRWEDIEAALGSIPDTGHEWDDDPAGWVRAQRGSDPTRTG